MRPNWPCSSERLPKLLNFSQRLSVPSAFHLQQTRDSIQPLACYSPQNTPERLTVCHFHTLSQTIAVLAVLLSQPHSPRRFINFFKIRSADQMQQHLQHAFRLPTIFEDACQSAMLKMHAWHNTTNQDATQQRFNHLKYPSTQITISVKYLSPDPNTSNWTNFP